MQRDAREAAVAEYFSARASGMRRTAYLVVRDWHTAEDLVQVCFIQLYKHWPRIRTDTVDAFARRTLVNLCLSHLRKNRKEQVMHPERGNPDRLWFQRSVEVRRGGIYLTSVSETVHAPDLASAEKEWLLDPAALREIAAAPALVFPRPPKDDNGCDYVAGNEDHSISCTTVSGPG